MLLLSVAFAADVRFVVVGDTQATSGDRINLDVWPVMAEDINTLSPDLVLFCGDLVNGTTNLDRMREVWAEWISVTSALDAPRYAAAGNHDFFADGAQQAWGEVFDFLPRDNSPENEAGLTYWFDVGGTRFISVLSDAEGGSAVVPRLTWLEEVLKESSDKEHIFVFTHHPVSFSTYEPVFGGTGGDFWQLLLTYNVDALLVGHWHVYQPGLLGGGPPESGHSGGGLTWEFISGTGGGSQVDLLDRPENLGYGFALIEVDGAEVTSTFYRDEDGDGHYDDVVDTVTLQSAAPPPPGLVAWYPFDEDLADRSGRAPGIPFTSFGDARIDPADWGGAALVLDGDDDYLQAVAVDSYEHNLHGDLTLSVAANASRLGTGDFANTLVTYAVNVPYTQDEQSNYAYWLSVQADGTLVAFWEHGDGENVELVSTQAAAIETGTWHLYTMVRDVAAMEVRFYVDGVQLGAPVAFSKLPTGGSRGLLTVGIDPPPGEDSAWQGSIDELCIFDRPLSNTEISQLYADRSCAAFQASAGEDDSAPHEAPDTTGAVDTDPPTPAVESDTPKTEGGCGCGSPGPVSAGMLLALWALRRSR